MLRYAAAAFLALFVVADKGLAHEFWISPETYRTASEAPVIADLRVGQDFLGATQSYVPRNFERFEVVTADGTFPVEGRIGDLPALDADDLPEGLAIVVHETTARDLTWDDWDRFVAFAEHKALGDVAAMQEERGLDMIDVREEYFRYAKSLIAVGHGRGADAVVGLRTELVALANPYTDDLAGALPIQLWLDGEPRRMAQVEVFARPVDGGDADLTLYQTDGNGIAVISVAPDMEYLVNAVTLEPVDPTDENGETEWRTLWASLTFEVPRPETTP
jgi:uncharacterized GH25 family protein